MNSSQDIFEYLLFGLLISLAVITGLIMLAVMLIVYFGLPVLAVIILMTPEIHWSFAVIVTAIWLTLVWR